MKLIVTCPAKINTFLSVGPPGAGGYHPIRSVIQSVGLFDMLHVEPADTPSIVSNVLLPERNTLTKTISLLRDLAQIPALKITLDKKIPMEAGLGGGSSDAAGLIRAICFITGLPMDQHVKDVASAVGKDVPFFLVGGRALAEGLGDQLTPLDDEVPSWLVIAKPGEGVSSGDAYVALDEVDRPFNEFPMDSWSGDNDFLRIAPPICQELVDEMLDSGASSAGLSGSGSAVWGKFNSEKQLSAARLRCQQRGGHCFICPTLTREQSLHLERIA